MSDIGTEYTDRQFEEVRNRLQSVYRAAQLEIIAKLNDHSQKMFAQDKMNRALVEAGKMTQAQYDSWLRGQMFTDKLWKDKLTQVSTTILLANEQANRIIEGERRAVFGENATFQAYQLERGAGMDLSFTVYDSAAVTRLIREQPNLLPPRKINGVRDKTWNREKISSVIAQGIITGMSIPEIAQRIAETTAVRNYNAAVRYARTAMTGAQNAGRMEVLHEAVEMGIKVKKVWLATLDERTREAHEELDGQVQDVNEPFDSILGPIDYPGDPTADDANVWNCRCSLTYEYEEYPLENARRYDQFDDEEIEDMTYGEWLDWKEEY